VRGPSLFGLRISVFELRPSAPPSVSSVQSVVSSLSFLSCACSRARRVPTTGLSEEPAEAGTPNARSAEAGTPNAVDEFEHETLEQVRVLRLVDGVSLMGDGQSEGATELTDAGGPPRPDWQLTWSARVRASDFVARDAVRFLCDITCSNDRKRSALSPCLSRCSSPRPRLLRG
jgi:hypothetical protein